MRPNSRLAKLQGKMIIFEGIDGSGKTTQAKLLTHVIESCGNKVLLTSEPGTLNFDWQTIGQIDEYAVTLLYLADRIEHWASVILPALNDGYIVVCDRFLDSSRVYQRGYLETVDFVHSQWLPFYESWLSTIFWLNTPAEESYSRVVARDKPKAKENLFPQYLRRVSELPSVEQFKVWQEDYASLQNDRLKDKRHTLDSACSELELHQIILQFLMKKCKTK